MTNTIDLGEFTFDAAVAAGLEANDRLDHVTALRCFSRAANLRRTQFALTMLAVSERRLGNLDAAKRLYREALALPGEGDYAMTGLVATLSASGDPFQALPLAGQVLARRPNDRVALMTVHTVLTEAKRKLETQVPPGVSFDAVDDLLRLLKGRIAAQSQSGQRSRYRSVALYEQAVASGRRAGVATASPAPTSEASQGTMTTAPPRNATETSVLRRDASELRANARPSRSPGWWTPPAAP